MLSLAGKPPRQHSAASANDPGNKTDPIPGQEYWSIDNLPGILYVLRPITPQIRRDLKLPTKESPWPNSPRLRVFSILPDKISSNVEEWRVEAWMRLDRRIQLHDITDRMNPQFRIANNALQQRGVRFRKAFGILSWGTGNRKTEQLAANLETKMLRNGIDPKLGTTRGLTPGLIFPALGEAGGRIPVPKPYRNRHPLKGPDRTPVARSHKRSRTFVEENNNDLSSDNQIRNGSNTAKYDCRSEKKLLVKREMPDISQLLQTTSQTKPINPTNHDNRFDAITGSDPRAQFPFNGLNTFWFNASQDTVPSVPYHYSPELDSIHGLIKPGSYNGAPNEWEYAQFQNLSESFESTSSDVSRSSALCSSISSAHSENTESTDSEDNASDIIGYSFGPSPTVNDPTTASASTTTPPMHQRLGLLDCSPWDDVTF